MRVQWTPERTSRLQQMWLANKSISDMADAIGATYESIRGKIRDFQPKTNRFYWSEERDNILRELAGTDMRATAIAEVINKTPGPQVSKSAVIARCHRIGAVLKSKAAEHNRKFLNRVTKKTAEDPALFNRCPPDETISVATISDDHVLGLFPPLPGSEGKITILELETGTCRFVTDEGEPGDLPGYCGQPTERNEFGHHQSWCQEHMLVVFTKEGIDRAALKRREILRTRIIQDRRCIGEAGW